jgi:hypothetical protein
MKTREEVLQPMAKDLLKLAKGGQPNPTPGAVFYTLRQDLLYLLSEIELQAHQAELDPEEPKAYLEMLDVLRDAITDRINRY